MADLPRGLPANSHSEFQVVDPEGAPDANGVRHHAAYDWMLGPNAKVPALAGGKVVEANPSKGNSGQVFGGTVKIQLPNGQILVYRHVSPLVRVGQKITVGQVVATTVRWSDNPSASHTHIELWKTLKGGYRYENMIDPLQLSQESTSLPAYQAPEAPTYDASTVSSSLPQLPTLPSVIPDPAELPLQPVGQSVGTGLPGSVSFTLPQSNYADTWQMIASQPYASPESRSFLNLINAGQTSG